MKKISLMLEDNMECKFTLFINYVGARIYQGIRMIKQSEMRPLGGATFWDNHLLAVTTIFTPFFSLS